MKQSEVLSDANIRCVPLITPSFEAFSSINFIYSEFQDFINLKKTLCIYYLESS